MGDVNNKIVADAIDEYAEKSHPTTRLAMLMTMLQHSARRKYADVKQELELAKIKLLDEKISAKANAEINGRSADMRKLQMEMAERTDAVKEAEKYVLSLENDLAKIRSDIEFLGTITEIVREAGNETDQ